MSNAYLVPAFFKILTTTDFTTVLRIPPGFSRKHKVDLRGNVKLVVDDSGRIWNVKVERKENGSLFCFTRGWPKFVEDAALQFGEFLVFSLTGNSQFHVQIYKTDFCQREIHPLPLHLPLPLPLPPPTAPADPNRKTVAEKVGRSKTNHPLACSSKEENPLYLEKCMKEFNNYRIYFPAEFVKASGLMKEKHVRVEYVGNGNHCSATFAVESRPGSSGIDLVKGWPKFFKACKLVSGKIYSFEFDPNRNLILVNPKK